MAPRNEEDQKEILEEAKALRKVLTWFGRSMLAGMAFATGVAVMDHFELKNLTSQVFDLKGKFDRYETTITPKVDRMWYGGGYAGEITKGSSGPSPAGRTQ